MIGLAAFVAAPLCLSLGTAAGAGAPAPAQPVFQGAYTSFHPLGEGRHEGAGAVGDDRGASTANSWSRPGVGGFIDRPVPFVQGGHLKGFIWNPIFESDFTSFRFK